MSEPRRQLRTDVIQHVAFEHAGVIADVARDRGHDIRIYQAGVDDLTLVQTDPADLLVVLGGPIGVYETEAYPWLEAEIGVIRQRLEDELPIIGACLGAQLIAAASGARVYPGTREIGWGQIQPTDAGRRSPLAVLANADWEVLHWHGDTFDLPEGAERLASTAATPNQAYAIGRHVLALQFHPEVKAGDIETWLIGHTVELAKAGVDPRTIRRRTAEIGATVASAGELMFARWMEEAGL
ncbi:glutamine amidotransferase [Cupriavidus pauculus]|uniref:Glutamine amidotransferase n=1 Tax=Cupriavidus pauculus TaxID=82633 RepID=A0A2N5C6K7_9BURK|nr:glutamine amidotransferase [Cupriavidus pauculus]PLP97843.1 glutamine amidotransferase [Cupriavidus pauculus]